MVKGSTDLTVNRYAKARREKLIELTEAVGEATCAGMEKEQNCAIHVPQKGAGLTRLNDL